MAEIIGLVGVASQLVEQVVEAISLVKQVWDAYHTLPDQLSRWQSEMEEFRDIVQAVQNEPAFEEKIVIVNLKVCSELVTDIGVKYKSILGTIKGKGHPKLDKLFTTFRKLREEGGLDDLFNQLNRRKGSLLIIINEIQPRFLRALELQLVVVDQKIGDLKCSFLTAQNTVTQLSTKLDRLEATKTQIALEHAYRVQADSPTTSVYWINASTSGSFHQSFRRLVSVVEIPGIDLARADVAQVAKQWLEGQDSGVWLLIIDNADELRLFYPDSYQDDPYRDDPYECDDDAQEPLSNFFPDSNVGSIPLTTRTFAVANRFASERIDAVINVDEMTNAETAELIFSRSGLGPESVSSNDLEKLLGAYLQYLALAITQAACYISERKKFNASVSDYLKLLEGGPQHSESTIMDTLSKEFEAHGRYRKRKFQRHPVAFTCYISFLQIKNSNKQAVKLLSTMATVDRSQIPRDLLLEDSEEQYGETPKLIDAIAILENYHLVTSDDGRVFNMHQLVHLGMRKLLTEGKLDSVADGLLIKLSETFPKPEDEKPEIGDIYASHAKKVIDHDVEGKLLGVKLDRCHYVCRHYLRRGDYNTAFDLARKGADWSRAGVGKKDPKNLGCPGRSGICFTETGPVYRRQRLQKIVRTKIKALSCVNSATASSATCPLAAHTLRVSGQWTLPLWNDLKQICRIRQILKRTRRTQTQVQLHNQNVSYNLSDHG
ncbi:uncharacterized protein Z519_04552 [Cladophialophora bantiana CBS 173.52]|uniref:Fungal N-terminal domain-containing protein n=1 Tax=Cladophialophora bantiana (strain ATCC 10958 / CBS 173.52 / CDC B-1940 / NIH 8579) TaxID=1442370 RepID=A0A0D2EXE9_CLAB1|nr:uncharacterized protein Z519_04552 [Cladophialophora bantiana CBS 173.52]KIW94576.1 hypothetical protein Z519_04552 [Cladophialophora bantiana CBS 173.52]